MSFKSVSIYNIALVFVGNFNPSIVSPSWLARKGLIRDSEADNANLQITHPEISRFTLSFVEIQVTMTKFQLTCENQAEFEYVKDLAVSIFTILSETPVSALGFNHFMHFKLSNIKEYNGFGNWLSPLSSWENSLEGPKILELKIIDTPHKESNIKNQVTIVPSDKLPPGLGVRIQLNYHIELNTKSDLNIDDIFSKNWKKSFEKADLIRGNIAETFKA